MKSLRPTPDNNGRAVITIAHLSTRFMWAKKRNFISAEWTSDQLQTCVWSLYTRQKE